MDDVVNDHESHRCHANLRMFAPLAQPISIRPAASANPRINQFSHISLDDLAPQSGLSQLLPVYVWNHVRELQPTVGDFNGGIALVRRRHASKLAVEKTIKPIRFVCWTHEHWLHKIRVTRGCTHPNICAFPDTYRTQELAVLYLEPCDLGTLKDLKENLDTNNQRLDQIHTRSILGQLTAALCYLHSGFDSYMQAADSVANRIPAGK